MVDETGPALVSFAGGFFSGRIDSQLRESAQQSYYNLTSVDAGPLGTGATVTGAQTTALNGYQLQAANTYFSTVAAGSACVLPQTSRPTPLSGLILFVANVGANPLNCFVHPNDPGGSINLLPSATPVILGANSITPFQCFAPGIWLADSIGTGFAGSLETVISQGNVAAAGNSQGTATPITQGMVNITSGGASPAGATLPVAKPGLQISVGVNNGANNAQIYGNGSDTIGSTAGSVGVTQSANSITIYMCFVAGAWIIK
jgi:hypothetical protein